MRAKDYTTVGRVLGRERRDAAPAEEAGIDAAIGAIRGHLTHTDPSIDPAVFDKAVADGQEGRLGW